MRFHLSIVIVFFFLRFLFDFRKSHFPFSAFIPQNVTTFRSINFLFLIWYKTAFSINGWHGDFPICYSLQKCCNSRIGTYNNDVSDEMMRCVSMEKELCC